MPPQMGQHPPTSHHTAKTGPRIDAKPLRASLDTPTPNKTPRNDLRVGSLFTGYGGLDMATQSVFGGQIAWLSDNNPAAMKLLAHHHPNIPNLGDITKINWADIPPISILTGGPPCQDISIAGQKAGMVEGTRSNLWVSMRDAIATLKPKLVIWENVHGALSAKANSDVEYCTGCMGKSPAESSLRAFGRVLGDMASLGYDAQWNSIRISDIGGCHHRRRVFMLAYPRGGESWIADRLSAHAGRILRQNRRATATKEAPRGQPYGASLRRDFVRPTKLLPTPVGADQQGTSPLRTVVHTARDGWGDYLDAIISHEELAGREAPDPTEPGRHNPRLSPRFVEWMMCLPDAHVTGIKRLGHGAQLTLLGNGVAPIQAEVAIRHLAGRLKKEGQ